MSNDSIESRLDDLEVNMCRAKADVYSWASSIANATIVFFIIKGVDFHPISWIVMVIVAIYLTSMFVRHSWQYLSMKYPMK
jgi:hypothetical protein